MLSDEELLEALEYYPLKEDIEILFDEVEIFHDFETLVSFSKEWIDLDNFDFKQIPICKVRLESKTCDNFIQLESVIKEKSFLDLIQKIEKALLKQGVKISKKEVYGKWVTYHLYSKLLTENI